MNGLSWSWIVVMLVVPEPIAVLVASLFWRTRQTILGNIAGSAVIFGIAVALISREHSEIAQMTDQCLDAGTTCWPTPSAFTRFAIYAFIALLEVFTVFILSLTVERRIRNRQYSPEWR